MERFFVVDFIKNMKKLDSLPTIDRITVGIMARLLKAFDAESAVDIDEIMSTINKRNALGSSRVTSIENISILKSSLRRLFEARIIDRVEN